VPFGSSSFLYQLKLKWLALWRLRWRGERLPSQRSEALVDININWMYPHLQPKFSPVELRWRWLKTTVEVIRGGADAVTFP
jgi:hypothetical protein